MRLFFDEVAAQLAATLQKYDVPESTAKLVAATMTENALDGIYTHGINRFPWLIKTIREGIVDVRGKAALAGGFGALERYDGNAGIGVPNAIFCMDRAIELARRHGIGCVAIRNTNHWMRAATYGYQACKAGMAAICFTNTLPNMPTWGALDSRLGNNPMTFAFPRAKGNLVCDMAMSQFSYGALELAVLNGKHMPIDAGFDAQGNLTRDPQEVLKSQRILPTGYWKGAALSHMLDVFAAAISLGNTTAKMAEFANGTDQKTSQVFIAINYRAVAPADQVEELVEHSVDYLLHSRTDGAPIIYTGQITDEARRENTRDGIPVNETVWKEILAL